VAVVEALIQLLLVLAVMVVLGIYLQVVQEVLVLA
jgi:hypothetical protein